MLNKSMLAAAALLLAATAANAQTGAGSLQLSGTLQSSIVLQFHQIPSSGIQITSGDGSSAAVASLSTVAMYSTPNGIMNGTNFTKSQQSDGFTLTGTFNVEVDAANVGSSAGYTLTAQLQDTDSALWSLNGSPVTSSAASTVTSNGTYAAQTSTVLAVKFPATMSSGGVGNTINFSATTN